MPCVHYKFQIKLTYNTLPFAGIHITVRELKQQIMRRERLKLCDLQISSAQTHEAYTDEEALIPYNTLVIVRRVPAAGLKSTSKRFLGGKLCSCAFQQQVGDPSPLSLDQLLQMENLAEANASEEDKIKALMFQSSLCYYSSGDTLNLLGLLPPSYVCFRCGIPGHHIKNCPTIGDRRVGPHKWIRKSSGIPHSFLVEVDDPGRKGVMMDSSGKYVILIMNAEAYATGKKEKPPLSPQNEPSSDPMPAALLCSICRDLLTDAVTIPYCRRSYCDECIRMCLLESDGRVCPSCRQSDVSPDALTTNTVLCQEAEDFRNGTRPSRSYQSPNHTCRSQSPLPASWPKKRSRSRSPPNRPSGPEEVLRS